MLVPAGCDDTTAARNILNRGGLAMLVGENDNTRGLPAPTVRLASALVVEGIANWIFGNASRSSRITITRALVSLKAGLVYAAAWVTCKGDAQRLVPVISTASTLACLPSSSCMWQGNPDIVAEGRTSCGFSSHGLSFPVPRTWYLHPDPLQRGQPVTLLVVWSLA